MPDDEMQKMGAALLAAAAEDPTLLDPLREWYRVQYETRASIPAWHRDRGTHHAGIGWRPVRRSSGFANTRTPQSGGISFGRSRISPRAISNLSRQKDAHESRP
ncbi:hypothetical protein [Pseudomonas aeruginosa]|uniref:hypothetical protein n=1 Tax=Pseudomonas aeruginosa TaxID=287 RepID=UPI002AA2A3D9|nr:hypothetical protein [Pseudomonas aeruginosa]